MPHHNTYDLICSNCSGRIPRRQLIGFSIIMVQHFVLEQTICFTKKIYAKGYGLSELRSMQHEYHQNLLMPYWTNPKRTTKNKRLKQCNWHFIHLNVIRVFESNSYRLHYGFGFSLDDNLGHFICDISRGKKKNRYSKIYSYRVYMWIYTCNFCMYEYTAVIIVYVKKTQKPVDHIFSVQSLLIYNLLLT